MADQSGSTRSTDGSDSSAGSLRSPASTASPRSTDLADKPMAAGAVDTLTDVERAQVIAELGYYAAGHREAIEAMLSGVVLGAEQVQNKRLDLLEEGAEDSILSSPLVAIVLTFVLEGSVGPTVASLICQRMLRPLFLSISGGIKRGKEVNRLKGVIQLLRDDAGYARNLREIPKGTRFRDWRSLARELDQQAEKLETTSGGLSFGVAKEVVQTWHGLTTELPLNMVALSKVARESALRSSASPPTPGTSAGVSVIAAAMGEAAEMRLGVAIAFECNAMALRQAEATVDDAKSILTGFRPHTFELALIRDTFALLGEGVIWSKHLGLKAQSDPSTKSIVLTAAANDVGVIDKRLHDYLRVRFISAAKEWLAGVHVVDRRPANDPGPVSAGTPATEGDAPSSRPLSQMESGGFSGGPLDVLTPQQRLQAEIAADPDMLVQTYLGVLGSKTTQLDSDFS